MLVPKTPVDKYCLPPREEDNIGIAWNILAVQTIAVTKAVKEPPDHHLRSGIAPLYRGHILGSGVRCVREPLSLKHSSTYS